ncbi:CopG family transcriptional regulator [Truepera radiovictrix]|uniref:CopG domain protein DNA-binding domain protein n=1 Tax=Truepera radiovictrix (strain DSM 17093 / CIP 108686 / LMG 22925 / RQ-24) TaxID=649638 RepID=D7CX11_TRURR|nr:CopG family transcriptional regulator [Truepera radiovictrix]ADI14519.1 CopG domain protein DNA-binding domain protein [Truepera radiovictrix DSM 17093]WMT56929.1 CopG family transcriptional regulator [Truepera radiovictrix]
MKRTTVYVDEKTDLELAHLARQQGRPKAELVREALSRYVERQRTPRPLPRSVGMGRSGLPDLAERTDELLGGLYEEEHASVTAASRERQRDEEAQG